MLSSNVPITPRPRPPAKMRRTSSQSRVQQADCWSSRSPPPYAPFASDAHILPTLLGSPITATSQLIHLEGVCETEERLQEKSKEELEELLRRASGIIRERERELDLTSETCKTLAENNASLKARNDTLIARLPPSQPTSPLASPSFHSGSFFSPSLSRTSSRSYLLSPILSPSPVPGAVRRRPGHTRRVSSTPAELAALADQNAELLTKLSDLEAEALRAEQAGKRRLRNLEAEIESLRDELESSRAESKTLEESMNAQPEQQAFAGLPDGLDKQVVKLFKRLSREAKVRELKAKTRPWDADETPEEPKNFAPENLTPGLPFTSRIVSRKVSAPNLQVDTSLASRNSNTASLKDTTLIDSPLSSVPPSATSTIVPSASNAREQALVSQLLLKIRELEETNAQLADNHLKASIRLKEAQTESESVRRLCEFISDEVEGDLDLELEVVQDDEKEEVGRAGVGGAKAGVVESFDNDPSELRGTDSMRTTFRLRSVSRKSSMDFGTGSSRHSIRLRKFKSVDSLSSLETSSPPLLPSRANAGPGHRSSKSRKTVLGLFEEDSSLTIEAPDLLSKPPFNQHQDIPSVHEILDNENETNDDIHLDLTSDAEAEKEEEDTSNANDFNTQVHSLGSELGLHLDGGGPELRPAPGLGHTRTKSIMELLRTAEGMTTGSAVQSPVSPFPSSATSTLTLRPPPPPPLSQGSVRSSSSKLRSDTVEGEGEGGEYFSSLADDRIIYPRLRRAKSTALFSSSTPKPNSKFSTRGISSPLAQRLGLDLPKQSTIPFKDAPGQMIDSPYSSSPRSNNEKQDWAHEQEQEQVQDQTNLTKLRALLLELWLWMYFVAVIVVFIFSLARKGPKVVLTPAGGPGPASVKNKNK